MTTPAPRRLALLSVEARLQDTTYSCGPYALYHALLVHRFEASIDEISRLAGTTPAGTEEYGLSCAATDLGYDLARVRCTSSADVYDSLRTLLHACVPVILLVDQADHWVTAVHATARHVWIVDSSHPGPPIQRLTWRRALQRLCNWSPERSTFCLYPVHDKLSGEK